MVKNGGFYRFFVFICFDKLKMVLKYVKANAKYPFLLYTIILFIKYII